MSAEMNDAGEEDERLKPSEESYIEDLDSEQGTDEFDVEGLTILRDLARKEDENVLGNVGMHEGVASDLPFDLRVARPRAVDLTKLWALTDQPTPPEIAAGLGPNVPILLSHVITPFPADGRPPGGVWGLGYEIVLGDVEANTQSVVPSDESITVGKVGNETQLGLDLGGGIEVPNEAIQVVNQAPSVSLTGAKITASTKSSFQFAISLSITFRKVIGAPVGAGGAKWQMFRQDEPLDKPHPLLQTLLVKQGTESIPCTIKSWAKKAGVLGTRLFAKYYRYPDVDFTISLLDD